MLSEKKNFSLFEKIRLSASYIENECDKFHKYFWSYRFDNSKTAINYIMGLFKCSKGQANMERMEEEVENSEYRAYQQFITNSNWDCDGLCTALSIEASEILTLQKAKNKKPIGYIIDESAH